MRRRVKYGRRRVYTVECTHGGKYTQGGYTWREHTRRSTHGREYTNTQGEYTRREHTRRSTDGGEYMSEIADDRRL